MTYRYGTCMLCKTAEATHKIISEKGELLVCLMHAKDIQHGETITKDFKKVSIEKVLGKIENIIPLEPFNSVIPLAKPQIPTESATIEPQKQEITEPQPQTIKPFKAESLQKSHAFKYAITHKTYETHCFSCPHLLGYYSDREGKFGTVECNTEVCNKR